MVCVSSLFSQILTLFPRTEFHAAVRQHEAERNAKGFTCWEQFVAMMFCQAEVFFQRKDCKELEFESLHEGQQVEFDLDLTARPGVLRAHNVRVAVLK